MPRIQKIFAAMLVFLIAAFFVGADNAPTKHRVLIISIDGLRPDLLLRAKLRRFVIY